MARRHARSGSNVSHMTGQMLRDEHHDTLAALSRHSYSGASDQTDDAEIQRLNEHLAVIISEMRDRGLQIPGPYHQSELDGVDPK